MCARDGKVIHEQGKRLLKICTYKYILSPDSYGVSLIDALPGVPYQRIKGTYPETPYAFEDKTLTNRVSAEPVSKSVGRHTSILRLYPWLERQLNPWDGPGDTPSSR